MLKAGLIGLGLAAGIGVLFALLVEAGAAHFGSCGPDQLGLLCILGFLVAGGGGILLTVGGLIDLCICKLRPQKADASNHDSQA
jgi:hypothetical protein